MRTAAPSAGARLDPPAHPQRRGLPLAGLYCALVAACVWAGPASAQPDVIDVYLMGGQSNMEGVGRTSRIPTGYLPQDSVQLYHSTGTSSVGGANHWIPNQANGYTGGHFGPEIGMGHELIELQPDAGVALIKHANGGTDLAEDWDPGTFGQTQTYGPEYLAFVNTVAAGLAALAIENPDAEIRLAGMVWQQGEEDSKFDRFSADYGQNLANLVARVREEFATPDLLFVLGTVHDVVGNEVPVYVYNDRVIDAQQNIDQYSGHALSVSGVHVVESSGYATHGDVIDGFRDNDFAHFTGDALVDLGEAYAWAFTEAESLRGDVSGDRSVGVEDLDILLTNWGQAVTPGDFSAGDADFSGAVGQGDLDLVLLNWSNGAPPAVEIPEPQSGLILGSALWALCVSRGQRAVH
ncbi:hypothetical protein OT109_10585 [Phycisphaeraceae bacterium D3-23]